jgi:hypothetical protein
MAPLIQLGCLNKSLKHTIRDYSNSIKQDVDLGSIWT